MFEGRRKEGGKEGGERGRKGGRAGKEIGSYKGKFWAYTSQVEIEVAL